MKINSTKNVQTNLNSVSKEQAQHGHLNHMSGVSYDINNPITQLRIVASSCFFGEPMYYHEDNAKNQALLNKGVSEYSSKDSTYQYLDKVLNSIIDIPNYHHYSPARLIETSIDAALDFDPEATLKEAVRLRNEENIRTTPQVIMVRAANHPKVRGTGLINKYFSHIMKRTDEASVQLAYQVQVFGKPIPNALKKSWKKFLENRSEYELAKYKMENRKFKTVDVVNLVRAHSVEIDSLMKGGLKLSEDDTWEALISQKGSTKENWTKAVELMGHMALLRNIRNLHQAGVDPKVYVDKLVNTAKNGKQLPFRYYAAYQQIKDIGVSGKVLDAVEKCLELSLGELPTFSGKVMSLCDNSGSAQGTTTSSMGTVRVADIANLTAVLTGKVAEDGYIGIFGDKLKVKPVRKNASVFDQVKEVTKDSKDIGMGTENGIWMFFDKAIKEMEHWDHIFVYSDMQAGHGDLYGLSPSQYKDYLWNGTSDIDVAKLITEYRKKVNPDVKVYLVQVAGYRDTLVPEFYDKTYVLGGWGDGILRFAHYLGNVTEAKNNLNNQSENKKGENEVQKTPKVIKKKSRVKM